MTESTAAPPGERFNFARHLFELDADRAAKVAYIDDVGSLTYGELETRARRVATALRASGIRREDRVLLLMHDCNDWPSSFLGALYAGVVPVAINTMLTADDYAYILEHSRSQAVLVSAALMPVLKAAIALAPCEVETIVVSNAIDAGDVKFDDWIAPHAPMARAVDTSPDDVAFWLYSSGSTGRPKGTVHAHGSLYWTAELYAKPILGLTAADVTFSAAKLFFAYGLGNSLTFPLTVGATVILMAERPTPDACFARMTRHRPTVFFGAPTGFAGMLASPSLPSGPSITRPISSRNSTS